MSTLVEQRQWRVFLCDDTPELRRLVRRAFDAEPDLVVVGEADDPIDGLPLIESLQPQVVLLDLSMPRMDGLEAITEIAQLAPDAAIVVFSGLRGESLAAKARGLGADSFVEKSAPLPELVDAVRDAVRRRESGETAAPVAAPRVRAAAQPVISPARVIEHDPSRLPGDGLPVALVLGAAAAMLALATLLAGVLDAPPATLLVLYMAPVVLVASRSDRLGGIAIAVITGAAYALGVSLAGERLPVGSGAGVLVAAAALAWATHAFRTWVSTRAELDAEMTRELRRANAELDQFATVASHDLSAPLRTISGFATMLSKRYSGQLGKDADECLAFINAGTARMSRTIEDLLAFARAGRVDPDPDPFPLTSAIDEAALNLKTVIDERGALVTHGALPRVTGDRSRLVQLIQNLLANAIKFCPADRAPEIEVRAAPVPSGWRVEVRDNGIGIDPRHAARVFGMFQRLHTEAEFPGTGVGLAICQRIVERHGGHIWVDGTPGGGTVVCFTLPDAA